MLSLCKKILIISVTVLSLLSFSFLLIFLIPGDPVDFILKDGANLEDKNLLRQEMGLNKSFIEQYLNFLKNFLTLNLGYSVHTGEPVWNLIKAEFPYTFFLSCLSLALAVLWGLPLGILSSYPQLKKGKLVLNFLPLFLMSIPVFVSAPFLIWFFANKLSLLPVSGSGSFSYLILPSVSLALPLGAILMKISRASLLDALDKDYVRTAFSKGLSAPQVYGKHILKNALTPIITVLGLQMGALLTGTVIIETIFDRPGIGSLLYQSIISRDYPVIQALILLIALIYIFINKGTDWLYSFFNPLMKKD